MDSRTALVTLARFAQGQWGMVTSAQAVEAGVSYMQLKRMTEAGLLEKAGQGVYLMIGGQAAAARHRAVKVAWLRMDPAVPAWERPLLGPNSAIVSHRSAAILLQLGDLVVRDMEFTTPRRRTSRDQMVRLRVSTLAPYEVTWAEGLPVTTALRTLTDLLADGAEAGWGDGRPATRARRRPAPGCPARTPLAAGPGRRRRDRRRRYQCASGRSFGRLGPASPAAR